MSDPGPQESMYNMSRVRVGADLGGILAIAGTIAVVVIGVPPTKWFIAAALATGAVLAAFLSIWHRRHPGPRTPPNSIRQEP